MLKPCPVCGHKVDVRRSLCPTHLKEYGGRRADWPYWLYVLVTDKDKHIQREYRHKELPFNESLFYKPADDDPSSYVSGNEHGGERSPKYWAITNRTILDTFDKSNFLILRGLANGENQWPELPPPFRHENGYLVILIPIPKRRRGRLERSDAQRIETPEEVINALQQIDQVKSKITPLQWKILLLEAWKIPNVKIAQILNISRNRVAEEIKAAKGRANLSTSVTT